MLEITIPKRELFDESTEEFIVEPEVTLVLEHSLVSLSKWESKWETPFLSAKELSQEQTIDYIRCMAVSPGGSLEVCRRIDDAGLTQINDYIAAKMTATWFAETKKGTGSKEIITAELIYYWMVSLSIPFECQYWHLSRLLTLVRVCNEKNQPPKKMSKSDVAARNRELNARRRAQMKTQG